MKNNQLLAIRLPQLLSVPETWGFGMSGLFLWLGTAPGMHAALGPQAIFVWMPACIVGMLLNLQAKRLGEQWPEMSGGTANYTSRLLSNYPGLGRVAALGYFIGWSSVPAINAIILTDLIKADLGLLGINCPETMLRIGLAILPFILAFGGFRALGILHLCFAIPAMGFLLAFCFQGLGWLAISADSPGFIPPSWSSFSFPEWAKWYFFAVYAVYDCETATSFVAESRKPANTLRCLTVAAWLILPIYLGGSWVLMQLATKPGLGDNTFLNLLAAAQAFWGHSASWLVTLLIVSSCLLSSATAVSNCPRILYQLALDKHLAPVFAVVVRQDVLEPAITFNLLIGLTYLLWGDLARILMVTGTSYLLFSILFHLALWLRRGRPEVRWPWWSLGFAGVEVVVLVFGGLAWNWQDLLIGLLLPMVILAIDAAIRHIAFGPFHPHWWLRLYRDRSEGQIKDFVAVQVTVLIVLVCSAATIGWVVKAKLSNIPIDASANLLIVLLVIIAFVAVAIACWTSLPQVAAIDQAREHAENLFITALDTVPDTILVLDESGIIRQANPAAFELLHINTIELIGSRLHKFFGGLSDEPANWPSRSELTLTWGEKSLRIIEATISHRANRKLPEYIMILRDMTERKQAEQALRKSEEREREKAKQLKQTLDELQNTQTQLIQTEKMSSLGQLVAGVAHEINNPVNFIYGNLTHVDDYIADLLSLIELYQQLYPQEPEIQTRMAEIDLEFLMEDLPKTLASMRVGTDRIRQIVLTLRNFSRLDEAQMKPVNIHEGIDSTLLILQNRLKEKPEHPAIHLIKEYGDLPPVECYAGQLNQVFMNILSNSIDAMRQSAQECSPAALKNYPSTITIRTLVLDGKQVRISIKDNGPGMSESIKKRVFDPFFTTKPVGEGTGLGLSISYQIIVEKHGGQIECLSELGQGAEFQIEIPIKQNYQRHN